ncbi:MAG TPA: hypothetical protein PLB02_09135 [Thermoanaerobaculia bacterium]|nr:hypothetical protein [Thermoanaerobaculia bacterium]HQR67545.1 hypothetical protein [Thermoanaerobaculia bacterium]
MNILSLFRPSRSQLKNIEHAVLDEFLGHFPDEAAEKFRAQMADVNLVQRHAQGREVCLYVMRHGRVARNPGLRVQNRAREATLGALFFRVAGVSQDWSVTFNMVEGYLFSLDFDPSPRAIWDRDTIECKGVRLGVSPLAPSSDEPVAEPMPVHELQGWPKELADRYEIRDVDKALPEPVRRRKLAELDIRLPHDYEQLLEVCDGLRVDSVSVLGLREAYTVNRRQGRFVVIADFGGEAALGVDHRGALFVLPFHEEKAMAAGDSLRAAIEAWLLGRGRVQDGSGQKS